MTLMAKKTSPYVEFLLEHFRPLGEIHARAMFGGYCLYADGITFAIVADEAVYLKADDVNRPAFLALGLEPFRPFPDSDTVMQYYPAPADLFESPEGLREWAGGAIAAGRRADRRKGKRKTVS